MSETMPPPLSAPPLPAPLPPANAEQQGLSTAAASPPRLSFNERFPFPTWLEVFLAPIAFTLVQIGILIPIVVCIVLLAGEIVLLAGRDFILAVIEQLFLVNCIAVIPLLMWGRWRSRLSFAETIGLRRVSPMAVLAVIPLFVGLQFVLSELNNVQRTFVGLPNFIESELIALHSSPIGGFVALAVIAPFTEEPLFRGLLLGGLLRRHRAMPSLVVTSFLFAAIHLNPVQIPYALVLGLVFGWVFIQTGSLWPCLAAHATCNAINHVLIYVLGVERCYTEPAPGVFQPLWLDLLGVFLLLVGVFMFRAATKGRGGVVPPPQACAVTDDRQVSGLG